MKINTLGVVLSDRSKFSFHPPKYTSYPYGMPKTVEMDYMDAEHWLSVKNYVCQLFTDKKSMVIEIEGSGADGFLRREHRIRA